MRKWFGIYDKVLWGRTHRPLDFDLLLYQLHPPLELLELLPLLSTHSNLEVPD